MPLQFIASTKPGHFKLVHDGYLYIKNKQKDFVTYWECEDRKCGARVASANGGVHVNKPHDHVPTPGRAESLIAKNRLKEAAASSREPAASIVNQVTSDMEFSAVEQLPKNSSMTRMVQRQRSKNMPKAPNSLADFPILTGDWINTKRNEPFMIMDTGLFYFF